MCIDNIKEKYINFYTDYAFKKFFGTEANSMLLVDFLNQLLFKGRKHIKGIRYNPTELVPLSVADKASVFDVYCESDDGEGFIVEMQNARQEYFKDRTVYYASGIIRNEGQKGDWNYKLPKIYSVNILNFDLARTNDEKKADERGRKKGLDYITHVRLREDDTMAVFYDKLTFVYVEMTNFNKSLSECTSTLDKWLFAIKHLSNLESQPEELKGEIFNRLFEVAEVAKFDKEDRAAYETSLNNMRDYNNTIETSYNEGEKKGIEKGIKQERISIIRRNKSIPVEMLASLLGITTEEVEEILRQIN